MTPAELKQLCDSAEWQYQRTQRAFLDWLTRDTPRKKRKLVAEFSKLVWERKQLTKAIGSYDC